MATQKYWNGSGWVDVGLSSVDQDRILSIQSTVNTINTRTNTMNTTLNTVNSNLGTNANAASATGSVHAKLKDLKTDLGALVKPRGFVAAPTKSSYPFNLSETLINITGKGMLRHFVISESGQYDHAYHLAKVYIDGTLQFTIKLITELSGIIGGPFINSGDALTTLSGNYNFSASNPHLVNRNVSVGLINNLPFHDSVTRQAMSPRIFITEGLSFNSSLRIVLETDNTHSASGTLSYLILGETY